VLAPKRKRNIIYVRPFRLHIVGDSVVAYGEDERMFGRKMVRCLHTTAYLVTDPAYDVTRCGWTSGTQRDIDEGRNAFCQGWFRAGDR